MSAQGIFPDTSFGGVIVTDSIPDGVTNAYIPGPLYTLSCSLTYYGSDCDLTRYDPQQINALEAEMIALSEAMFPTGTWNCGSVTNLANAFRNFTASWAGGGGGPSLALSTSAYYPLASGSNTTAASPGYVSAAVTAGMASAVASALTGIAASLSAATASAVATSEAFTTASATTTIATAQTYTDSVAATTLTTAETFATTSDATILSTAQTYTNTQITAARAGFLSYPTLVANDILFTTPKYVGAAIAAAGAGVTISHFADYPTDVANDTKVTTPKYVAAAVTAGAVSISHFADYPTDVANDTKVTTPKYVAAAVAASGVSISHFADYPTDVANDTKVATPKYIGAAIAAAGASATSGDLLSNPPIGTTYSVKNEYASVAHGATVTIIDYTGAAGYLQTIMLATGMSGDATGMDNATINIYIDGSGTPSISMPAEPFLNAQYMADGTSIDTAFANKFFGSNMSASGVVSYYSRLPIPYNTGIKITLTNGSSSNAMTFFSVAQLQTNVPNNLPRTRKFHATYNLINSNIPNSTITIANDVPGVPGRLVGIWLMNDDVPNSMLPVSAPLEGNFRFYFDIANVVWQATTAIATGKILIDSNGNKQTATTGGTSGSSVPTWNINAAGTTTDGTITWTQTPGTPNQVWIVSKVFSVGMALLDLNGNIQMVTTAGTSDTVVPTWNVTVGGTTTDNGVTWTNQGSTYVKANYQSSGTEDYYMMGFYGNGVDTCWTGNGEIGTTYGNPSEPMNNSSSTRSFYRYHITDPIGFQTSIAMTWQVGDTSQKAWTGGFPKVWIVAYYYTEG